MRPSRTKYDSNQLDWSYTVAVILGINPGYMDMTHSLTFIERNEHLYNWRVRSQWHIRIPVNPDDFSLDGIHEGTNLG